MKALFNKKAATISPRKLASERSAVIGSATAGLRAISRTTSL